MFYLKTALANIKRYKYKSFLNILICILVVYLLNIYVGNIDSTKEQLADLPAAIPVSAGISNLDGTMDAGLKIKEEIIRGIEASEYIKDAVFTVQLKMGLGVFAPEDYAGKLNYFAAGINDIKGVPGLKEEEIRLAAGSTLAVLQSDRKDCIMDRSIMEKNGLKTGDTVTLTIYYYRYGNYHEIFIEPLTIGDYRIVGSMNMTEYIGEGAPPSILLPLQTVRESFRQADIDFTADSASFWLIDPFRLNDFKKEMHDLGLLPVIASAEFKYDGNALTVRDETFIQAARRLEESLTLLGGMLPLFIVIIAFIGYITAYLLIQNRRAEYATMRSLGMGKGHCFMVLFMEHGAVELTGCMLGSLLSLFFVTVRTEVLWASAAIFLLFYLAGTAVALLYLNRLSVMAVLTKND